MLIPRSNPRNRDYDAGIWSKKVPITKRLLSSCCWSTSSKMMFEGFVKSLENWCKWFWDCLYDTEWLRSSYSRPLLQLWVPAVTSYPINRLAASCCRVMDISKRVWEYHLWQPVNASIPGRMWGWWLRQTPLPHTVGAGCDLGNDLSVMRSTNNVRITFQGERSNTIQKMHCVVTLTGNIKEGQWDTERSSTNDGHLSSLFSHDEHRSNQSSGVLRVD
jgi:hypothetical protein